MNKLESPGSIHNLGLFAVFSVAKYLEDNLQYILKMVFKAKTPATIKALPKSL